MQWQLALRKVYMTSARFHQCMIQELPLCRSREICMFPRGGLRRRRYLMSALFCTREFSSATPEDRAARRPRGGMCKSRRLPQGIHKNIHLQLNGYRFPGTHQVYHKTNIHETALFRILLVTLSFGLAVHGDSAKAYI